MRHSRNDYNRIQDPLALIPADEPVFLLRAQDLLMIPVLIFYRERLQDATGTNPDAKELLDGIEQHINLVRQWQALKGSKICDVPNEYESRKILDDANDLVKLSANIDSDVENYNLPARFNELSDVYYKSVNECNSYAARLAIVENELNEKKSMLRVIVAERNELQERVIALSTERDSLMKINADLASGDAKQIAKDIIKDVKKRRLKS